MDEYIKSELDEECKILLEKITKEKDTILIVTKDMGIVNHLELVPFVMGTIHTNLQTTYIDLCHTRKIDVMDYDFTTFWKLQCMSLREKVQKIYSF